MTTDNTAPFSTPVFEYQSRTQCICGNTLGKEITDVIKKTAWGNVYFVRCPTCGSYMQSPQISTDSLAQWYDSDTYQGSSQQSGSAYANYEQDEQARVFEAIGRYSKHISPFLPDKATVLEIGCATGSLLSVIRKHGHTTIGIDLSSRFAEAAKRIHGLDIIAGDFMEVEFEAQSFDAIIFLGTASNMQDLPAALEKMRNLLKDTGFILFNFPHADSIIAKLYGKRYWMFGPSASNFMTVNGCQKMLERLHLTATKVTTDSQQPSLSKLLHHSKLDSFIPHRSGTWANQPIPLAIPIPAVKLVRSIKTNVSIS